MLKGPFFHILPDIQFRAINYKIIVVLKCIVVLSHCRVKLDCTSLMSDDFDKF